MTNAPPTKSQFTAQKNGLQFFGPDLELLVTTQRRNAEAMIQMSRMTLDGVQQAWQRQLDFMEQAIDGLTAHIGSFGVIGVGGVVAFVVGAIMMFPSGTPGFALSLSVVAAATLITAALFLLVLTMLLRSRRRPVVTGKEGLLGAEGETVAWDGAEGRVRVQGEIWRARAQQPLQAGERIRVIEREGLVLVVEPA